MNRPGMTLMEVLVALVIGAAALSAGYAAFATVADGNERARARSLEVARAAAVRHTLAEWLRGARLSNEPGSPPFQGLDAVRGDFADDEILLLTTSPTALDAAEVVVRLFVDRNDSTPERGLTAEFAEWKGSGRQRMEIAPDVAGLDLRYVSGIPGEDEWYPSWISTSILPRAIELRIQPAADTTLPPLLSRPIVVPIGGAP